MTGLDVTVGELRVLCHHEACQHAAPIAQAMLLAPGDLLLCATDGAHRVRREDRAALAAAVAPMGALELLFRRFTPGHGMECPAYRGEGSCECGWPAIQAMARAAGVKAWWV